MTQPRSQVPESDPGSLEKLGSAVKAWAMPVSLFSVFASYLFGGAIRLFANDFAEVMSGFYLTKLRRKTEPIAHERFPYPFAGNSFSKTDPAVFDWYKKKYADFASEGTLVDLFAKKYFFNRCKADLYGRDSQRAQFHERVESFVRFLAGSLVANLFLLAVCLPFSVYFWLNGPRLAASTYVVSASISFLVIIAVLERFRNQHTREVMTLWVAYYDACQHQLDRGKDGSAPPSGAIL
jgi:hypothetical protein